MLIQLARQLKLCVHNLILAVEIQSQLLYTMEGFSIIISSHDCDLSTELFPAQVAQSSITILVINISMSNPLHIVLRDTAYVTASITLGKQPTSYNQWPLIIRVHFSSCTVQGYKFIVASYITKCVYGCQARATTVVVNIISVSYQEKLYQQKPSQQNPIQPGIKTDHQCPQASSQNTYGYIIINTFESLSEAGKPLHVTLVAPFAIYS